MNRAIRAGHLISLAPGVLIEASAVPVERRAEHLLVARAEILSLGDHWCCARRTAAVVHGLPLLGWAPASVQLTRDRTTPRVRSDSRHRHINTLPPSERTVVDDLPVTTRARTVFDIARRESFRSGVVVADAALRSGLAPQELLELLDLHPRWPGVRKVRRVLAFADGRAESPLESLGRVTCLEEDLPVFEPQVEVWVDGRFVARVDGLWREQLVVFEGDGGMKFTDESVLPALLRRQERIREAGLPVVRGFWEDVTRRRAAWATGVRRELADNPGRLRDGVDLRPTEVVPKPLDRSDHYRWPPPVLDARRVEDTQSAPARRAA